MAEKGAKSGGRDLYFVLLIGVAAAFFFLWVLLPRARENLATKIRIQTLRQRAEKAAQKIQRREVEIRALARDPFFRESKLRHYLKGKKKPASQRREKADARHTEPR